jgi:hypothetical protein
LGVAAPWPENFLGSASAQKSAPRNPCISGLENLGQTVQTSPNRFWRSKKERPGVGHHVLCFGLPQLVSAALHFCLTPEPVPQLPQYEYP